jgi:hypothetical protein
LKTLILSNQLTYGAVPNITSARWNEAHPSLADFQCVVLDMMLEGIAPPVAPNYAYIHYQGFPFYILFDDIIKLLQAGGVLICLNYYTFINRPSTLLDGSEIHRSIFNARLKLFNYEYKYNGVEETSYDWCDLGLLKCTEIDRLNVMPGNQFEMISTLAVVNDYFKYVHEYHKTIQGIVESSIPNEYSIKWDFRGDTEYQTIRRTVDEVEILAITKVTNEPIAVTIKYRNFPGTMILLPTCDVYGSSYEEREVVAHSISLKLSSMGKYYYEQNKLEQGTRLEQPEWLLNYRAKPAKDADKEIESLEKKKASALVKREKHDSMLVLINGYGTPLENAVEKFFGKEWLGFDVEKTSRGYPIDMFVKNTKTGGILAVQVTGVVGKFLQGDKHFGALMNYLPEHSQKITDGKAERIVLVINTYRDTPLAERDEATDISTPVLNIIRRNGICLVRSKELYRLWQLLVESPRSPSPDDIFEQLFDCEGIWKYGES